MWGDGGGDAFFDDDIWVGAVEEALIGGAVAADCRDVHCATFGVEVADLGP